jgi:hypothetical protein
MNNLDYEKTQIWAKNLINAPLTAAPVPVASAPEIKPVLPIQKPVLKKLSKEEKIILATGGALAVGLGAIVITSLSDDNIAAKAPVQPAADLQAPTLDLGIQEPEPLPVEPEPVKVPPAPHHAPPKRSPAAPSRVQEEHHSLLEIPEIPEVATTVGDDLTFIEAFNTARSEVGPAGLFAWRNTYYSTFTDKEWETVPEDQKKQWLDAAEPIINPEYEETATEAAEPPTAQPEAWDKVMVAERGTITWTGIDKDGDGQAEILMARINGQSPMVLLDTDDDGILDTRFDYDAASGKTFASAIEPFSMSTSEIAHLEDIPVGPDMGFFNHSGNEQTSEKLPVSIYQSNDQYVVSLDSNHDNTVDVITYLTDERGPVVGMDFDNDGQIERGFVYDAETQSVSSVEMEPMDEINFGGDTGTDVFPATEEEGPLPEEYPDIDGDVSLNDDDSASTFGTYFDGTHSDGPVHS